MWDFQCENTARIEQSKVGQPRSDMCPLQTETLMSIVWLPHFLSPLPQDQQHPKERLPHQAVSWTE